MKAVALFSGVGHVSRTSLSIRCEAFLATTRSRNTATARLCHASLVPSAADETRQGEQAIAAQTHSEGDCVSRGELRPLQVTSRSLVEQPGPCR